MQGDNTPMSPALFMAKIRSLPTEQLIALEFDDKSGFRSALHRALEKGIPYDLPGRNTLIVERVRAYVFTDMQPKQYPIKSATEFSPKERAQLHKRHIRS